MPEEKPATTPDAAGNNTENAATNEATTQEEAKTFTQEDVNKLVGSARKEERSKLQKQLDDAKLSEEERQRNRVKELESENRTLRSQTVVAAAAKKAGAENGEAVFKLVKDDLEYDDKGAITNLQDAINAAKELAPQLFGKRATGNANGGEGNEGTRKGGFSMNDLIRRSAGRV